MSSLRTILHAYYEQLYNRLRDRAAECARNAADIVGREARRPRFPTLTESRMRAYLEAVVAFYDERIEMYDPFGLQYTFGPTSGAEAFALEDMLDWYSSRAEFAELCERARDLLRARMSDADLAAAGAALVRACGAYPDRSIIRTYESDPQANHLPDYALARALETMLTAEEG